jgi:hypothetical protein
VVDAFFWQMKCCLQSGSQAVAYLGTDGRPPLPIDLQNRIIDRDSDMDIATFRVTEAEVTAAKRSFVRGPQSTWPPNAANNHDHVYYCGFPGVGREWIGDRALSFSILPMGGYVTSAREDLISIQIEREKMADIGPGKTPENFNFGGISGAPLLARSRINSLEALSPIGVIIKGPNTSDDPDQSIAGFEVVAARPIQFILADGTLDKLRWQSTRL